MWLPWQQGRSIFLVLLSKHHIFRKSHKISKKGFCRFGDTLQKPEGGGDESLNSKNEPPKSNTAYEYRRLVLVW